MMESLLKIGAGYMLVTRTPGMHSHTVIAAWHGCPYPKQAMLAIRADATMTPVGLEKSDNAWLVHERAVIAEYTSESWD